MFSYNKFLEFPVKVSKPNPRLANVVITQYGGPNGELGASLRYLSQRYTMPDEVSKGLLTDIGTEELAHLEIVGSLVAQLSKMLRLKSGAKWARGSIIRITVRQYSHKARKVHLLTPQASL